MAKKAKAEAKRAKRLDRGNPDEEGLDDDEIELEPAAPVSTMSNDEIMEKVADLHRRYDDGQMDLDTFDEEKALLMGQISID